MCGRYDLNAVAQELAARFAAKLRDGSEAGDSSTGVSSNLKVGLQPRYNIAPGQHNPVVVTDASGNNQLDLMRWGLVPSWSREPKLGYSTINARAETVASKPTFRKSLASQRCLVPATGYFEWVQDAQGAPILTDAGVKQGSRGKQPYRIHSAGSTDRIFAFAGLYDIWQGADGEELRTYAIVTTRANNSLSAIHARMPVILPTDVETEWLDRDNS